MLAVLERSTNVEGFLELNRHHNLFLKDRAKEGCLCLGVGGKRVSWSTVDVASGEQRVNNVGIRFFQLQVSVKSINTRKLS